MDHLPNTAFSLAFARVVEKTPHKLKRLILTINARMPSLEGLIASHAHLAYYYARNVIKGRWPDAEPLIAQDALWAYNYACGVIKDRWPEDEPAIAQNARWAYYYAKDVIKGRFDAFETRIHSTSSLSLLVYYMHEFT